MRDKNLFLLILLATCWGPSFMFIKIAVAEVSPLMLTALRIGIAALILNVYLLARRERLSRKLDFWKKILVAGFFGQALPFTLINWGEQYVDSSMGALLNGLTPISTIVLAQLMLKDERMTRNKISGVFLGFLGLMVLVAPSLAGGITGTTLGILSVTGGAFSYGIGLVYIRKNLIDVPPNHAPAAQLLSVTLYTVPLAFIMEPDFSIAAISWKALASIAVLGSFGTALAFVFYYKLLERTSASYVSTSTYLMPIYGVVLGVIFLDEVFTSWMLLGSICILAGVSLVNGKGTKLRSFGKIDPAYFSKIR